MVETKANPDDGGRGAYVYRMDDGEDRRKFFTYLRDDTEKKVELKQKLEESSELKRIVLDILF